MARPKTAQIPENIPAETGENEDWTLAFAAEKEQIVVNIRRMEPVTYQGIQINGHLAQLTLSPEEAVQLANLLIGRWGGGLYGVQWLKKSPNGAYGFDKSFRIRCAGVPKLDMSGQTSPTPAQPAQQPAAQPAQMWQQPMVPPAYPWPPQPTPQPNNNAILAELPRLLGTIVEIARGGSPSAAGQPLDTVALVQALQTAVRPEDDFSKFERFASLMNKLAPKTPATTVEAVASIDWVSLANAAGSFLSAFRQTPQPAATQGRVQPVAPIPSPPGMFFDGQKWVKTDVEGEEEGEEEEEEEGEEEEEEEAEEEPAPKPQPRKPLTAEELAMEFQRMDPNEQAKIAQMATGFANVG